LTAKLKPKNLQHEKLQPESINSQMARTRIRASGIISQRPRCQLYEYLRQEKATGMDYPAFDARRRDLEYCKMIFLKVITVWRRSTRHNPTRQINLIQSTMMAISEAQFHEL
jgi:hypothetical protein